MAHTNRTDGRAAAPQSGQRVLRTATNGMQVWVPVNRLEAWEAAQKDQSPEAQQRRSSLASAIKSELLKLRDEARRRSE